MADVHADKSEIQTPIRDAHWLAPGFDGPIRLRFNAFLDEVVAPLEREVARLAELIYVPGVWRCAKCKLSLVSTTLHVNVGKMSANNEPQQCPNGCGPLWRKTEREAGNELCDRLDAAFAPPTKAEIDAYRDLFRRELDKNMHNSSSSPSTDAHHVALHAFVEARNRGARARKESPK